MPLLVAALGATSFGCTHIPEGRTSVDAVRIHGADAVDDSDIKEKIATQRTPKFLGLFRGVLYDYEVLDRYVLDRDLSRIERYYRSLGYYEIHAREARIVPTKKGHADVEIVVEENDPVLVRNVTVKGGDDLPPTVQLALRRAQQEQLTIGKPFTEEAYVDAEQTLKRVLLDASFATAEVSREATVDVAKKRADVTYKLTPGPSCTVGAVTIQGLGDLPEDRVRKVLDLQPGKPYSQADIDRGTQDVLDLGVLAFIDVSPDLSQVKSGNTVVPLVVKTEPGRLHTISAGGGVEFNTLKLDLHLSFGWQSKNFLGGLRQFRIEDKPGVVLYPTRLALPMRAPNKLLPENQIRTEIRQPGFFEARTTGFVRLENSFAPILLQPTEDPDPVVIGNIDTRGVVGVDRPFGKKLFVTVSETVQVDVPKVFAGDVSKASEGDLQPVFFSYVTIVPRVDLRDNKVKPTQGAYFALDLQFAGIGGPADIRVQPDVRGYLKIAKGVTLGARASVGFLFHAYDVAATTREPATASNIRINNYSEIQTLFFRGFFSGGPSSNRGYPFRGIGPRGLYQGLQGSGNTTAENTCPKIDPATAPIDTVAKCTIPIGGTRLWEANVEARIDIASPFSISLFCDASDVPLEGNFTFNPHLSCGPGFRVDTPVGPVRLDLGFRIPGAQISGDPKTSYEQLALDDFPAALNFGLGEAF